MNLIHSATAAYDDDDVDQVPAMPVDWKWFLEYGLINLAGWLLLFTMFFLLAYYTLDTTPMYVEQ